MTKVTAKPKDLYQQLAAVSIATSLGLVQTDHLVWVTESDDLVHEFCQADIDFEVTTP